MNVTEAVLPNGLRVPLMEEHKAPVVTFQACYRVWLEKVYGVWRRHTSVRKGW